MKCFGFVSLMILASVVNATNTSIAVVGLSEDSAVIDIHGKLQVLKLGQISPQGITLISADSEEAILEIDEQQSVYKLSGRVKNLPSMVSPPSSQPAFVRILPNQQEMYITQGSINNHTVHFLVDTGATLIAMSSQQAQQLGIPYQQGEIQLVSTASEVVKAYRIRLDKVQVGDITLYAIESFVLEGEQPKEILLGMSFLNHLEMRREGKILELRQRR
jgi:aspartyl protease family protein